MASGKTTLSQAVSRRLGHRYIPLDVLRYYYYAQQGMDFLDQADCAGLAERLRLWQPYHLVTVRRVLGEFPDAVHDFGAGHAHFERPADREAPCELMGPLPKVFLILPSADLDRSEEVGGERDRVRLGEE